LPEIEKAHTYVSENADIYIYRSYDRGQINYRNRAMPIFARIMTENKRLKEEVNKYHKGKIDILEDTVL